jgi:hypothetical protein
VATNVSTIRSSGGDYTSITTWESATDNDLVTAGDIEVAEYYADQTWTDRVTIAGATTDASNYRIIRAASGERHDGTSGGGGVVIDPSSTGHVHTVQEDYFRADWLRITGWSGTSSEAFRISGATGFRLSHSIIHDSGATDCDCVYTGDFQSSDTAVFYISNCIFFAIHRMAIHCQGATNKTVHVSNCTFAECGSDNSNPDCAISDGNSACATSTANVKNCALFSSANTTTNNLVNSTTSSWTINLTNCATDEADFGTGETEVSGNQKSLTYADQFVSTTGGSEDFHLKSGSDLEGAGVDLDSDATLPVTDDIDGDTRDATAPDIGADEFVAAAVGGPRGVLGHPVTGPLGGPI